MRRLEELEKDEGFPDDLPLRMRRKEAGSAEDAICRTVRRPFMQTYLAIPAAKMAG